MVRTNDKKQIFSYENAIKKSNELSMAKLSQGLTLNQMQLLAYAIFSTQQNGKTEFNKTEFEHKFNLEKYQTTHAKEDSQRILDLKFSIEDLENDRFEYYNVFQSIKYDKGDFRFKWTDDMIPHILELKEKYVSTDLTITSKFKSGFSWTLYDFLRAHFGFWHKPISKEGLMKLLGVEGRKSYINSTAQFKRGVLDVAIAEINKFTEIEVEYTEEKEGRAIIGFDLKWSTGTNQKSATKKQIRELRSIVDTIMDDSFDLLDNIKNEADHHDAIGIIKATRDMIPFTQEPICITYDRAYRLLQDANWNIKELNKLAQKKDSLYYNWLEE